MTPLTHFSLFSGIGGLDLAAEWAGFETVGQVERADYQYRVLQKHWPNVPKWRNIEDVTIHTIREAGIEHAPTVLSGGFPCQPFSCAGQRRGAEDDRYLWPEMLRVVQELRPAWVVGENVAGIINLALDDVLTDLERAGYACRAFLLPAAGVGAPHMRDRVFIVANDDRDGCDGARLHLRSRGLVKTSADSRREGAPVADTTGIRCEGGSEWERRGEEEEGGVQKPLSRGADVAHSTRELSHRGGTTGNRRAEPANGRWWDSEPPVGRVVARLPAGVDELGLDRHDYGVPYARNRAARLRCLGNAVVPQQAYPVFQAIAAIETGAIA